MIVGIYICNLEVRQLAIRQGTSRGTEGANHPCRPQYPVCLLEEPIKKYISNLLYLLFRVEKGLQKWKSTLLLKENILRWLVQLMLSSTPMYSLFSDSEYFT